ncbi:MAG: MFS transporter [Thermomicrobiales bacterium]
MRSIKRVANSQIFAVCVVVFIGDMVAGFVSPTFSLLTEQLGISLVVLGLINTIGGLTSVSTSFPIGALSDRISRVRVIRGGMVGFMLATAAIALADSPSLLIVGRILIAISAICVFRICAAHLGDVVSGPRRSLAFGAYATALGSGVTVGSFLGGYLGDRYSLSTAYWVASAAALFGLLFAVLFLRSPDRERSQGRERNIRRDFGELIRSRPMLQVGIASVLVSFSFSGTITTFFPLRAENLDLTTAQIGTIFAVRGVVSTLSRLPSGFVARYIGDRAIFTSTLFVELIVMLGLWQTTSTFWFFALLAFEGFAYGGFMVSSQSFVTNQARDEVRGSAIGLYATATGLGATLAPLALGVLADRFDLVVVFPVTASLVIVGIIGIFAIRSNRQVSGAMGS